MRRLRRRSAKLTFLLRRMINPAAHPGRRLKDVPSKLHVRTGWFGMMRSTGLTLVGASALAGCSVTKFGNTFEGANDFRIVPAPDAVATVPADCRMTDPSQTDHNPTDADRVAVALGCYSRFQYHPSTGAPQSSRFFTPSEQMTMSLKTLGFSFFTEGWAEIWSNKLFRSPVKGEIAILANVTQGPRTPGGMNSAGQLEGKVVYYGNDVFAGQLANEFNVPIYGPQQWAGGPVTIDIWVLELDEAESRQFGPILKTLAGVSSKLLGMAGSAEQVLNQVGTAFLNSNRDDVIGHTTLTLVPPSPGLTLADPILQVSDIVFQRNENNSDRARGVEFDRCYYEATQAKVYCKDQNGGRKLPNRNSFVLSIRRSTSTVQMVSSLSLEQLNGRLQGVSNVAEINAIIEDSADKAAARAKSAEAQQAVARMADGDAPAAVRRYDADQVLSVLQCGLLAQKVGDATGDARKSWEGSYEGACGTKSIKRAISMDDFNLIGRQMTKLLSFDAATLSGDKLIGSTVAPDAAALKSLRDALAAKSAPRPATP